MSAAALTLIAEAPQAAGAAAFLKRGLAVLGDSFGASRLSFLVPGLVKGQWVFAGAQGISDKVVRSGVVSTEDNVLSFVLKNREGVAVSDMALDGRFGAPKKLRYMSRSFAVVPVLRKGKVAAVLCLTEPGAKAFGEAQLEGITAGAEALAAGYDLLARIDNARVEYRQESEREGLAALQRDLKPRLDGVKFVDGAVTHTPHPSPFAVLAQAEGVRGAVLAQCASTQALRVFPVLTTVLHRDALSLAPSAGAMKRLKVSASVMALEANGESLRLSAPGWATCWHFESRTKKLKTAAPKGPELGRGTGAPGLTVVKWKAGDMFVALNPGAVPGRSGFEKKLLDSLLRHHREPAKKLALAVAKECLPAASSEHLVAVWKNTKKG